MTVTVLAILETDFIPQKPLAKVMNERLQRLAKELEQQHLGVLYGRGFSSDDLTSISAIQANTRYVIRSSMMCLHILVILLQNAVADWAMWNGRALCSGFINSFKI